MPNILLIDDDKPLCELLSEYLVNAGYAVHSAHDGGEGLRELFAKPPDLVLLDVTMPRQDGWDTLRRIREMTDLPIVMLTARDEEADILRGFSLGADDYVTKPFSFAQLAARIQAVLHRMSKGDNGDEQTLHLGDLEINQATKTVTRGDSIVKLTPTEFKLLVVLIHHVGEVVSPEDLVREVWGPQYADEIGNVRRYIWHLRQKIETDPEHPRYIFNERGFGYWVT